MFNLLVKFQAWGEGHDRIPLGRIGEYTSTDVKDQYWVDNEPNLDQLAKLPTLFVQESTNQPDLLARVGMITRVRNERNEAVLDYAYETGTTPIPNVTLQHLGSQLDIGNFELTRTHWAVKEPDLYRFIHRNFQIRRQRPNVFTVAEFENLEPSLVAVMMPFDSKYNAVYRTLKRAAESVGLRCRRADDFWEHPQVIQDVVSLIDRASVVICDCTGRNPNVFYEAGIAHTLGRDVILITQSSSDIPFDLRHLRYVSYLDNAQGRRALGGTIASRLSALSSSDN